MKRIPPSVRMKEEVQQLLCGEAVEEAPAETPMRGFVRSQAFKRGRTLIAQFRDRYPAAMECLERDLEECVTYLRFPAAHQVRIRTTNRLERLNGEGRRRTKVIPRFPTERSCLALLFASLVTASKRWRGVKMTPAVIKQLQPLRAETAITAGQKAVA